MACCLIRPDSDKNSLFLGVNIGKPEIVPTEMKIGRNLPCERARLAQIGKVSNKEKGVLKCQHPLNIKDYVLLKN
jgi:hypothetical protein